MRGQLSLEYLLLALVSLSLISVSVLALGRIKQSSEEGFDAYKLKSSAEAFSESADELCAMGYGNSRTLHLYGLSVASQETEEGWLARFSDGKNSIVKKTLCEISDGDYAGEIEIENYEGVIRGR